MHVLGARGEFGGKTMLAFVCTCVFGVFTVCAGIVPEPAVVVVNPDHSDCLYETGETARLAVRVDGTNGVRLTHGVLFVRVDNFGSREILSREIDLSKENPFCLTVGREDPGFVRLGVTSKELMVRANAGQDAGT